MKIGRLLNAASDTRLFNVLPMRRLRTLAKVSRGTGQSLVASLFSPQGAAHELVTHERAAESRGRRSPVDDNRRHCNAPTWAAP